MSWEHSALSHVTFVTHQSHPGTPQKEPCSLPAFLHPSPLQLPSPKWEVHHHHPPPSPILRTEDPARYTPTALSELSISKTSIFLKDPFKTAVLINPPCHLWPLGVCLLSDVDGTSRVWYVSLSRQLLTKPPPAIGFASWLSWFPNSTSPPVPFCASQFHLQSNLVQTVTRWSSHHGYLRAGS